MARARELVKAKFGGRCAYCGNVLGDKWHVDHKEPIQRIMKWDRASSKFKGTGKCHVPERKNPDNEYPACIPCNMNKSSLPLEYWRRQIESRLAALNERSTDYKTALRFGQIIEQPSPVVFWFERAGAKEGEQA